MKAWTVRELYQRFSALIVRDEVLDMEVTLRLQDDDGNVMVGGITGVDVDPGCTEIDSLMIDGSTEAESVFTLAEHQFGKGEE